MKDYTMTAVSNNTQTGYYPQYANDDASKPQRKNKVYYGSGAPPEKRGKEISEEDYKKLEETKLGAKFFVPKQSTIKQFFNTVKKWFTKQVEKPHHITIDEVREKGQTMLDLVEAYKKMQQQQQTSVQQNPGISNYTA